MAKNLSERLLDMVETDPRFIGLTASQVLAWLKIIRLLDRNATRVEEAPEIATTWKELRFRLHLSDDRLLTLIDILHERRLLGYSHGAFRLPAEALRILNTRPFAKRAARESEDERRKAASVEGDDC